jgi:protein-L-isoaspartate(D-aspartate) O-methyltransferase
VPQALIDQLAPGGRLVAPVGGSWEQRLTVIDKGTDGKLRRRYEDAVMFVPMRK